MPLSCAALICSRSVSSCVELSSWARTSPTEAAKLVDAIGESDFFISAIDLQGWRLVVCALEERKGKGRGSVPFAVRLDEVVDRSARGASKKASLGIAFWTRSSGVLPVPMTVTGADVKVCPS